MSRNYDNWERLVAATLMREQFGQLCLAHSRETSISSTATDFTFQFESFSLTNHSQVELEQIRPQGLAPEEILVNGKPLRHEELTILQSCRHPPKNLIPGSYWYDKVSGFWGKHGQKPSQIVSPNLNVGGALYRDASNGNARVYVNGREITKVELRMLKFAGVKCWPDEHFWLYDDGSYALEASKIIRGRVWSKAGIKLLCSILSLPFPPKISYTSEEQPLPEHVDRSNTQKLLLIGCSGSGTSTIFNQAKILYSSDVPFSKDEIAKIKWFIRKKTLGYIRILLEGRENFEEENLKELRTNQSTDEFLLGGHANNVKSKYSLVPRLKAFSDLLLEVMVAASAGDFSVDTNFPLHREDIPLLEELLYDLSLHETLNRRSELEKLSIVADYFLERAANIFKPDYEPSYMDILYSEGSPSSQSFMDFSFPQSLDDSWVQNDILRRYELIRSTCFAVGDNYKLFDMFTDVQIIIVCISLYDYDQFVMDENGASVNKMMVGRKFFESIATHPSFNQINILLLLTNYDLFEEKVIDIPLYQCEWFNDFNPITDFTAEMAFHYISVKFKRLYAALTGWKLYVKGVKSLESVSVDAALRYSREILDWGL